jgi:hypothetical protein
MTTTRTLIQALNLRGQLQVITIGDRKPAKAAPKMPPVTRTLVNLKHICGYTYGDTNQKQTFHRSATIWLNKLAKELGLSKFDVRSNQGGPAVSGQVTLHGNKVYVQVSEWCAGKAGLSILYRECDGMRDYYGKDNHVVRMETLAAEEGRAQRFMEQLTAWASKETPAS